MKDHENEQLLVDSSKGGEDITANTTKNNKSFKMCGSKMSNKVNIFISCHWSETNKNICGDGPWSSWA